MKKRLDNAKKILARKRLVKSKYVIKGTPPESTMPDQRCLVKFFPRRREKLLFQGNASEASWNPKSGPK